MTLERWTRWSGGLAVFGGLLGLVIGAPLAAAAFRWYPAFGPPPLLDWTEVVFPLMFANNDDVYFFYGRIYSLAAILELNALYALRSSRDSDPGIERWAWRLMLLGLWLVVFGVVTDYWTRTPPGFLAVLAGAPILLVGIAFLAARWMRDPAIPSWARLGVILALPVAALAALTIRHVPTGPLVGVHAAWLPIGLVMALGRAAGRAPPFRNHEAP